MMRLCQSELHKFFHSRLNRVLVCFLLLFPVLRLAVLHYADARQQVSMQADTIITAEKAKQEADELRRSMQGRIQDSWLDQRQQEIGKLEKQGITREDVRYQTQDQAYWDAFHTLRMKKAVLEDAQTPAVVRTDLNKLRLRYGPYEGWMSRMQIFEDSAKVYAVFCLFLFGDMFNQEDASDMMELLKSCRKGRRKLAYAKLIAAFALAMVLAVVLYLILSVSTTVCLDLSGGDTTLMMLKMLQIYTFQEIDLQALGLLLISGAACTSFAVAASVMTKKPVISLGLGMLFFLLPMLVSISGIQTSWSSLFPSNFLSFQAVGQLMMTPWVAMLQSVYHRLPLLSVFWIGATLLLILFTIIKHCKSESWISMIRKKRLL